MPYAQHTMMLDFQGGGSTPVQYRVNVDSTEFYVRYRHGRMGVYANPINFDDEELKVEVRLGGPYDGYWNARETNVYLTLLSDSIQSGTFDIDCFPRKDAVRRHTRYYLGPFPSYPIGLVCGVHEPSPPPENRMNRHDRRKRRLRGIHDHDNECYAYIAAQDVADWIAENPTEHKAFKKLNAKMWEHVARELELTP